MTPRGGDSFSAALVAECPDHAVSPGVDTAWAQPTPSSILGGGLMARSTHVVGATVAVRVPLNADGDLVTAGTRIVERATAVDRVTDATVRGLEPSLNDITVTLETEVVVVGDRGEDLAVTRRALEAGIGVSVEDLEPLEQECQRAGETEPGTETEEQPLVH